MPSLLVDLACCTVGNDAGAEARLLPPPVTRLLSTLADLSKGTPDARDQIAQPREQIGGTASRSHRTVGNRKHRPAHPDPTVRPLFAHLVAILVLATLALAFLGFPVICACAGADAPPGPGYGPHPRSGAGGRTFAVSTAALTDLRQARNIQLFVLFVESTGNRTVTEYADEVARRSSLGGNDALLVVADHRSQRRALARRALRDALTDRELEAILSERVEPLLARGDFAGAVVRRRQRARRRRRRLRTEYRPPAPGVGLPA